MTADHPTHAAHDAAHQTPGDHGAQTGQSDHITHGHRTHHFDPARAERLVSEDRQQMLPAEQILTAAGLAPGQVMVDLGAGPGFFTLPAARIVGPKGRVYAADIQPQLLEMCRQRAAEAGITGIETVHSQESHVPLPDALADRVFIAFVLHESDDPVAFLREARRLLRPGGEVAIVDWHKTEGTPGPPLEHRVGEDDIAALAAQAGLRVAPTPTHHRSENYYVVRLAPATTP